MTDDVQECSHISTQIETSRWVVTLAGWLGVKRRRKCRACGFQFSTVEIPTIEYFKDGEEVPLQTYWVKPKG
jgi:transcriptional regulator NrdR family protein